MKKGQADTWFRVISIGGCVAELAPADTPGEFHLGSARAAGNTVAFDPNLRPRLWSDKNEMTDAVIQTAAVSHMVLPSLEGEAPWLGDSGATVTLDRYAAARATTVDAKDGAAPVHYRQGTSFGTVSVPPVSSLVKATAASGSFNAAIPAATAGNAALRDSIARACHLAGQVVQGKGALVPVDGTVLDRQEPPPRRAECRTHPPQMTSPFIPIRSLGCRRRAPRRLRPCCSSGDITIRTFRGSGRLVRASDL